MVGVRARGVCRRMGKRGGGRCFHNIGFLMLGVGMGGEVGVGGRQWRVLL